MIYLFILRKKVVNIFFKKVEFAKIAFPTRWLQYCGAKNRTWPRTAGAPCLPSAAAAFVTWQRIPMLASLQGILSLERWGAQGESRSCSRGTTHSEKSRQVSSQLLGNWLWTNGCPSSPETESTLHSILLWEEHLPGFLHLHCPVQISSTLTYLQRKWRPIFPLLLPPWGAWGIVLRSISVSFHSR